MSSAAAKPAATSALVSKDELVELAEWERKYADAKKKASAAEKELNYRRQALAEKVLGLNSSDELKALSPEKLEKLRNRRFDAGDYKLERNAPLFSFIKTHQGQYPSWRSLFIGEMGETAAARVQAETPISYSYAVEVQVV